MWSGDGLNRPFIKARNAVSSSPAGSSTGRPAGSSHGGVDCCGRGSGIGWSYREKRSQALRGRNLTRDIPASDAPTVHPAPDGCAVRGWSLAQVGHRSHASKNPGGLGAKPPAMRRRLATSDGLDASGWMAKPSAEGLRAKPALGPACRAETCRSGGSVGHPVTRWGRCHSLSGVCPNRSGSQAVIAAPIR